MSKILQIGPFLTKLEIHRSIGVHFWKMKMKKKNVVDVLTSMVNVFDAIDAVDAVDGLNAQ